MRLGLTRDMARVAREVLTCYGVDDIGDDTDRGSGEEGSRQTVSGSGTAIMSDS